MGAKEFGVDIFMQGCPTDFPSAVFTVEVRQLGDR